MDVAVEWFAQCSDVEIVSSSTVSVAAIPKYVLEVDGRGGGRPYKPNSVTNAAGESSYFSYPFRDYNENTYWQLYEGGGGWKHLGPPCVGGVEGNVRAQADPPASRPRPPPHVHPQESPPSHNLGHNLGQAARWCCPRQSLCS